MPALPDNWDNKALTELSAGHLIRLMLGFYLPMQTELKNLANQIIDIQKANKVQFVKLEKDADEIKELRNDASKHEKEVVSLKKALYNQQVFLENVQKKELRNNVIVSGIPNAEIEYKGTSYNGTNTKVQLMLNEICPGIKTDAYKLITFPSAEGRSTHVCKMVFKDYDTKMNVYNNTTKLKQIEVLKTVFIKWDEPRYTRRENSRLRAKKYNLSQQYPNDEITIKKGILYHNNVQCDKFHLTNQIF